MKEPIDIEKLKYDELIDLAKKAGIPARPGMKKVDLIAALMKVPAPSPGPDKVQADKPSQAPAAPAPAPASDYHQHQGEWESKAEKRAREKALADRKDQADLAKHPKFAKFKPTARGTTNYD